MRYAFVLLAAVLPALAAAQDAAQSTAPEQEQQTPDRQVNHVSAPTGCDTGRQQKPSVVKDAGSAVGHTAGSIAGGAVAGPVGAAVGGVVADHAGHAVHQVARKVTKKHKARRQANACATGDAQS